ncbi:hypothetical protein P7K49_022950 [Saguinus oedipus]|uniref:Uncharacterized protein n=1 Tax=Saguinus oedipus TaxID=9490 RepID=A0ABQ9UKB3_SAGOE|nr:hypothetical protein P7K49_022950 [Saguinus oedipus]
MIPATPSQFPPKTTDFSIAIPEPRLLVRLNPLSTSDGAMTSHPVHPIIIPPTEMASGNGQLDLLIHLGAERDQPRERVLHLPATEVKPEETRKYICSKD